MTCVLHMLVLCFKLLSIYMKNGLWKSGAYHKSKKKAMEYKKIYWKCPFVVNVWGTRKEVFAISCDYGDDSQ